MATRRVHILIRGEVQGVFFRHHTRKTANQLGIVGFVRNVPEGVEVVAQGDEKKIESLIEFCRKGPSSATVEKIEVKEERPGKDFSDFEIRY